MSRLSWVRSPSAATNRPGRRPPARSSMPRWGWAGVALGSLAALIVFMPAPWVADLVGQASHGRLQLIEAQGTLWHGSALPMLAGPAGSRDASVLPSRLHWSLRPQWLGVRLRLQQDCCIPEPLTVSWQTGWQHQRLSVARDDDAQGRPQVLGHWSAAWFEGLGAPFNTLRPGGSLQLSGHDLVLESSPQGWQLLGQAQFELLQITSRLSSIAPLGSYRVALSPQGRAWRLELSTLSGALELSGHGELGPDGLKLRGQARAAEGAEAALNNLLNIIGKREGAISRLSIG